MAIDLQIVLTAHESGFVTNQQSITFDVHIPDEKQYVKIPFSFLGIKEVETVTGEIEVSLAPPVAAASALKVAA
jgi:hypothetical protein